jgi:hypothetical protein
MVVAAALAGCLPAGDVGPGPGEDAGQTGTGATPGGSGGTGSGGSSAGSGGAGGPPGSGGSGAGSGGSIGSGGAGTGGGGPGSGGAIGSGGRGTGGAGTGGRAGSGGRGTGTGGRGTGGGTGSGGSSSGTGGGGGGSASSAAYPCNGTTSGYEAVVVNSGGTWTASRGTSMVYSGGDMAAAIRAGIGSLTAGRTSKQRVLVQGSGSMPNSMRIEVPSYTVLNVCGTIDVTSAGGSGDMAPIYARAQRDIEIPNLTLTGAPLYNLFFRDVDNLILGSIDARVSGGQGIRIDNHGRSNRAMKVQNIRIDYVYAEGAGQGVETYGVDNITIGTVVARSTRDSGVLLNDTTNAVIGTVDAIDAGTGTGYAAFRMANRNGRIGSDYLTNIRVGQVIARGGARGIFCVSESGGVVIDRIDIANTGNNSILIENCYNVNIAAVSGTVSGGGEIRIAARTEFANSRDITIQNLTVNNTTIREDPCADNSTFSNITLQGTARQTVCP